MLGIKLGTNVFTKEQKILEQQRSINELNEKLKKITLQHQELSDFQKEQDKANFQYKNTLNIMQIEKQQSDKFLSSLKKDLEKEKERNEKLSSINKELQTKLEYLLQKQESSVLQKNQLECVKDKITYELDLNEVRNTQLEKIISDLHKQREENLGQIQILEKSLGQKDKHIAILLKDKEKLLREKENEGQDKNNQIKKKEARLNQNPLQQQANEPLKEQHEIKKLKQQNNDLIIRLKNKQH